MCRLSQKTLLIIPCYNEEKRLNSNAFSNNEQNLFFLFVNDGSTDDTLEKLRQIQSDNVYILDLHDNVGKGEAVRQGAMYAQQLSMYSQLVWVGYWDADLSAPLDELYNFMQCHSLQTAQVDAIWGSRIDKLGSNIARSYKRHILGRVLATIISISLGTKTYDSQCGAKIFKRHIVKNIFTEPFVSKWLFDVEILLRMGQRNIIEYPLENWREVPGSKVNIGSDAIIILTDIVKIKRKIVNQETATAL